MGTCSQCGRCCHGIVIKLDLSEDEKKYLYFHGCHQMNIVFEDGTKSNVMYIPLRCIYIRPDGLCANYDNRPDVCKKYPSAEDWTPPGCTAIKD